MTLIEFFLLDQAKDLILPLVFWRKQKAAAQEANVRQWKVRKDLPVMGWLLRRANKKRKLTSTKKFTADKAIRMARWFVETKTFEHLVVNLLTYTPSRAVKSKRAEVGKTGLRRYWAPTRLVN